MLRHASLKLIACCLALSACVTINVYFPAAAAEKAADKIIEDVWGADKSSESATKRDDDKQTAVRDDAGAQRVLLAAAASVLDFIVTPAHAQANLNVETPAIRQLTQSMEARHAQLKKYYDSGAIGLTRDGLVQVRDQNLVPLPERNSRAQAGRRGERRPHQPVPRDRHRQRPHRMGSRHPHDVRRALGEQGAGGLVVPGRERAPGSRSESG